MRASPNRQDARMQPSPARKFDLRPVLGLWAVVSIALAARATFGWGRGPLLTDTDDAMRFVVVRDLLEGQNWFDHMQWRMNAPWGAEMHWSRLIDTPIAVLTLLFQPIAGADAGMVAAVAWPLILLLGLLWLSALLSVRLIGPDGMLPGLVLPIVSVATMSEFLPGRLDHHNVQVLLELGLLLASINALSRPRFGVVAGILAGTSLAIGGESLPVIISAILGFGLAYIADPNHGRAMRLFGLSFGAAAMVNLAIAEPPSEWLVAHCDALSIVYVTAALACGLVLALLPAVPPLRKSWLMRLLAGALGGALVIALVLILFPACRGGPYGELDPYLVDNWLSRIIEAKPVWDNLFVIPAYTIAVCVPLVLALCVIAWRVWRIRENRAEWLMLGLYVLVGVLVTLIQIRTSRLVTPLIVPAGAWLIVSARAAYLKRRDALGIAALVGSWLAFSSVVTLVVLQFFMPEQQPQIAPATELQGSAPSRTDCSEPAAYERLSKLPARPVMSEIDMAPYILAYTPLSVVGAPYHRNPQGLRDTLDFFNAPPATARDILRKRGIELVVICPYMPEMGGLETTAPDAFVAKLAAGQVPDYLTETTPDGALLRTFEVKD